MVLSGWLLHITPILPSYATTAELSLEERLEAPVAGMTYGARHAVSLVVVWDTYTLVPPCPLLAV
jgi:hypothetical protein